VEQTIQRPFTAASFNQYLREKKLMGVQCPNCHALYLPPRAICHQCQNDHMTWVELDGRGKLAAFTAVYIGPTFMNELGFDKANPYLTGVVALDAGVKISARLLGFEGKQPVDVKIDTPMEVDFLVIGEGEDAKPQLAFRVAS
jgi:uncharacterized OB-fold protein